MRALDPGTGQWETSVIFAPARLGRLLHELLHDGPPQKPIDVGV